MRRILIVLSGALLIAAVAVVLARSRKPPPQEAPQPNRAVPVPEPDPEAELRELARRKQAEREAFERLPERAKAVELARIEIDGLWGLDAAARIWIDGAPESPFVFVVERAATPVPGPFEDELRRRGAALWADACERFRGCFDAAAILERRPCLVYIFGSEERYRESTEPPEWLGGHFDSGSGRSYLYGHDRDMLERLQHELAHQVLFAAADGVPPAKRAPSDEATCWLTEGLTAWYESCGPDENGKLAFGRNSSFYLPEARLALSGQNRLRVATLVATTYRQFRALAVKRNGMLRFVAQSWAFVHFLETGAQGRHREAFRRYVREELAGRGGPAAAKECLGDLDALDREVVEFTNSLR